jgi:rare lipoprotein A
VRVNDRGPFMNDRIIDLSYTAAYKLGIIGDGKAEVEVESINPNVSVNIIAASTVQSQPLVDSAAPAPAVTAVTVAAPAASAVTPAAASAAIAAPAAASATPVVTAAAPAASAVIAAPAATPVATPTNTPNTPPVAAASLGSSDTAVYLQLGAFSSQAGAEAYMDKIRKKLGDTGKRQLKLTTKEGLVRVHIGPYANLSDARSSAESMVDKLGFKPMVNLP